MLLSWKLPSGRFVLSFLHDLCCVHSHDAVRPPLCQPNSRILTVYLPTCPPHFSRFRVRDPIVAHGEHLRVESSQSWVALSLLFCYSHLVRDQVGTVEANTELSNHGDVATSCHGLHESLGPRLCNGSQVVDQLVLGHANARVLNGQGRVGLVRNDLDEEVGLSLHATRLIVLDNCRPSQKRRLKTRSNHSSVPSFSN